MQPVNEDKFLCYSCNNWLINWYSLQNKNTSNSASASTAGTSSNSNRSDKTKSKIKNSIPEEQNNAHTMVAAAGSDDNYFHDEALELRNKLQKYLYTPKRQWPSDGFTVTKATTKRVKKSSRKNVFIVKCNLCEKAIIRLRCQKYSSKQQLLAKKRYLHFCQPCKSSLQSFYMNNGHEELNCDTKLSLTKSFSSHQTTLEKDQIIKSSQTSSSSQRKLVNPYVLSRLKKLGTTVVREGSHTSSNEQNVNDPSSLLSLTSSLFSSIKKKDFFIKNPHEIQSLNSRRNEKNEIVLAFDRTVTEVFPSMTKDEGCDATVNDDTVSSIDDEDVVVFNNIYKRIPKSLSITLLA